MPPSQGGIVPSAFPAFSPPSGVKLWPRRAASSGVTLAHGSGAGVAVILGDDELVSGNCVVKPLRADNAQVTVRQTDIVAAVLTVLKKSNGSKKQTAIR